ncbi:MAG TPA: NB-ARC domain-containing protein, partial [Nitrolancea sp.]|nr:NB-ARC domain-containing protein [Nitrolancea sp.]
MSKSDGRLDTPSLAIVLKQYLIDRGMAQGQLATASGVARATLSRWLNGHAVHPYHRGGLLSIAAVLGLRKVEANRLLRAAELPTIDALASSTDPEEQRLLQRWLAPVRNNLPAALTSFVGREAEIAEIAEIVCREDVRLVTLTGTGGSGKTRLALRIAREVLDAFPDGVFFVELAAISEPHLVIPTIAEAIDLRDVLDSALNTRLVNWLRSRRVLLLLDNLEHLLHSGPEVASLLREAPGLTVLTTSRIPLHVYGEYEQPVQPLPLPLLGGSYRELRANPAIELFLQRAQAANPRYVLDEEDLPIMAEICTRLDGLPLAIELAAARMRGRNPASLLADFPSSLDLASVGPRDVPRRQQTLRATIAWSVELLPEATRSLLLRLTVF